MAKKMLIDATHPEQTRVAVVDGHRLEEYDFETVSRKQLKGNIYLAKVIRIEPSLQAAFVEYGGNRHGFLAFTEIHHDYYRIPVADRQALEEAMAQERAMAEQADIGEGAEPQGFISNFDENTPFLDEEIHEDHITQSALPPAIGLEPSPSGLMMDPFVPEQEFPETEEAAATLAPEAELPVEAGAGEESGAEAAEAGEANVDMVGGDEVETRHEQRRRRFIRRYKIQEVIKRGQIMLVQVVKEERGNKGAALTTYLSLAGRYCVLMPNTDKGGGISRKITSMQDRRRMKDLLDQLDIPDGMACILRTAGMERSKVEVKRDLEYLLRLWDSIREYTLKSIAPSLIYEEANLIKRAMRDLYTPDIDTILVEGDEGYQRARDFMRMLMPGHARRVHHYRDSVIPLFFRYQVENQINTLHTPVVQLRSGGYIVINQTEALVAIDVNSGRSTRERNIEETAHRTNLEAAEEVARQLRLRDLAGLIVIDFIDMEDGRNNASVERRLKEAMRHDRARLQIGRISHFGLLELSRQRLRPSLLDLNFEKCPHCQGTGHIRLVESTALLALHMIEEEGIRQNAAEITIALPPDAAMYIINNKREILNGIEQRYGMTVRIKTREDVIAPEFPIERIRTKKADEQLPMDTAINEEKIFADTDRELGISEAGLVEANMSDVDADEAIGNRVLEGDPGQEDDGEGDGGFGDGARRGGRRRGRRGGRRRGGRDGRGEGRGGEGRFRDGNREGAPVYAGGEGEFAAPVEGGEFAASGEGMPQEQGFGGERQPRSEQNFREGRDNRGGRGRRDGRDGRGRGPRQDRGDHRNDNRGERGGEGRHDNRSERQPRGNFAPASNTAVPMSVFELDTTPRENSAPAPSAFGSEQQGAPASLANEGLDVSPEKKKTGWWQRLTGA